MRYRSRERETELEKLVGDREFRKLEGDRDGKLTHQE